ncbi:hypothetical protein ACFW04_011395 [Cataglyphis niger]
MDYNSMYHDELQNSGSWGGGIQRLFVGLPYQRGHGIGSFLGGLFRRVLPYLRGVQAEGKEALRADVNIIDDVENNMPFKVAAKHRFEESRNNFKRKAKEKISSLMKSSGYKTDAKMHVAQFPFVGLNTSIAKSAGSRKCRVACKKNSSKIKTRGKKKTNTRECLKSEFDLFSLPSTQTSIESSQWIHYKSVTSLSDDSPIEFVIPGHGEEYLDLTHTMLSLRVRVETTSDSTRNSISRDDYSKGYTLFAFDFTPDISANYAGHWNLVKHGSLRLEMRFEKALSETVNCIIYAEFDNVIEIDSSRQVIVDFAG